MIPNRDYYEDADGNLTTDPTKAVAQIAVKGHFLDERIARRYGIADTLISVDEPNAVRRVAREAEEETEEEAQEPQKPAEAVEPKVEEETPKAKKPTAKKEKKRK